MTPVADSATRERIRRAMAKAYFHCGAPAFVRPLRNRYSLAATQDRKWFKYSLQRRKEPSARILIYHRVNNENGPFFPAISTELFEEEMRFVHMHYTVVPLTELLDRLSGDSTEPVLAITFDDGYRDNYENAFPILQRYGLPATIFLTTGGLDSTDPLWFDKLALALKTTSHDSIDIEIGKARSLPLCSLQDRLAANAEIFALLREVPDAMRRQLLSCILRDLAWRGSSERNGKMLTWSQVRLMKRHGIDFGGHTVSHPFISRLSPTEVFGEVSECKRRIEDELQAPVSFFAYPNGREEDYGAWNKALIRKAGYQGAVTTNWGINYRSTDHMELKRGGPWEESKTMFAWKLDWYELVNG